MKFNQKNWNCRKENKTQKTKSHKSKM